MQELSVPIAIVSLIVLLVATVVSARDNMRGDEAMSSKKIYKNVILDIFHTMSANIVGGALLAKIL